MEIQAGVDLLGDLDQEFDECVDVFADSGALPPREAAEVCDFIYDIEEESGPAVVDFYDFSFP